MIIEESLIISGTQVCGSIDRTNSKGNVLVVKELIGMDLTKPKELTLEQVKQLQKEISIIAGKMSSSALKSEEYQTKGDS